MRAALLRWYDVAHRDLPWRRTNDPYHVWVSEIMLQQTRVETVVPYYERWTARYPTLLDLANADEHDVLKHWEGLGYYSRARNLHAAARLLKERYNSALPASPEQLRELPGIGDYTAGAIASIAYGRAAAAIDGNVRRVLARLYDVVATTPAAVRQHAAALIDPERPGDFNQAIMELGATTCTPRAPLCSACPLQSHCTALRCNTVALRPGNKPKPAIPHEHLHVRIMRRADTILIARRPAHGLLAGLWEFPATTNPPARANVLGSVTHTFTHKRITYHVHLCGRTRHARTNERWVALSELADYAMPRAQRRIETLVRAASSMR